MGLISGKSIFQLHIERILKIKELCAAQNDDKEVHIPVYIMTSDLNHSIIQEYFAANGSFGFPTADLTFFEQGLEPAFTHDGKIIVESSTSLSLSPDGNGGIYKALQRDCIADMESRGIKHLHIFGIDNVLTKSLDPLFIGTCIAQEVQVGNKVVWRAHASEKVGVTAELDSKMHILEYSEIPLDYGARVDSHGKLIYGAANICNHYLSIEFLKHSVFKNLSNSYHFANKKIKYFDPVTQQSVTPAVPNGVKLEMFIFDVFPLADRWCVVETEREDEFAPVKNEPGAYCFVMF
jgi:UDP-N-acetylglucosamine/UDP-N-acetylgalactosamine diphosphorylase